MYQLVIGNKNYSSWSLRPWLLMKVCNIEFEEVNIQLYSSEGKAKIRKLSAAGKVPLLIADGQTVWDSLAIAEYLAEHHPEKILWPLASDSRAIARSVVSEMHSSFTEIRNALPMNCRLLMTYTNINEPLQQEIDRICHIWRDCRENFGEQGKFLFGEFSIADAFYAPIVLRFYSYGIVVGETERQYIDQILSMPQLQEWISAAKEETAVITGYELIN